MVVLLIGDSHAVALTRFLRPLVEAAGHIFVANARGGIPTRRLGELLGTRADLTIIVSGTNDIDDVTRNDGQAYAALVERITREAGSPSRRVIWWGPPVLFRDDLLALPEWVVRYASLGAARAGASYVDSRLATGLRAEYDPRGVHPRRGYERWARRAWEATKAQLERRSTVGPAALLLGFFALAGLAWMFTRR